MAADPSRLITRYGPLADGLALLFHPHVEVVLHDLQTQTVVHIANNLSRRCLGDDSALEDVDFDPQDTVIGPYEKVNWDGRRIRSVSIVGRDDDQTPIAVICVNFDLSVFDGARAALDLILSHPHIAPQPDKLFRDDWQERINTFLQAWLRDNGQSLSSLDRNQKRRIVEALYAEGAFKGKSAPNYVANVLNLGRATVFNYLKALRD